MSKRLLVVEDTHSIASVIERIGKSVGYQVTLAPSFAVVKHLLAQDQNFFVATVDYSLPDAPNGEVIPYLIEQNIPCIVMTGRMDDVTHKRINNLPIIDYLTKESAQTYHYLLRILHGQLTNRKIGVLVVDDSLTARNHVAQLLKLRNFSVHSVADGTKAMQALEKYPNIKIVLTDQEMPGMSGIELVQKIRREYKERHLIIIGISGSKNSLHPARFIKNGADDYLKKPFYPEEFYCRIMQYIEKLNYIEEIEKSANTDYLTSLYNRRYFLEHAEQALKARDYADMSLVLVILYVDKFKQINDTHGHQLADKLLVAFANILKGHFSDELVARFGGAEFGLLLSGKDLHAIEDKLETLRKSTSNQAFNIDEQSIQCTLSIGGAVFDEKDVSLQPTLIKANTALSQVTKTGGDQLAVDGFIDLS